VKRRTFLKGGLALVGGIGADAALLSVGEPLAAIARAVGADSAAGTEEDPISQFESMGAGYTTLYWTLPPAQLLPQVEGHIQTGHELVRTQSDTPGRARAASALAEAQLLAGRLWFFDLQSPEAARGRFWEALESAEDGNDPLLPGVILGHASFVPGFAGKLPDAMGFLGMAERRLRSHELSPIRGWLESVRAEVGAIGGDVEASRAGIAKAEKFLDRGGRVPRWFDWFNEPRLGSFAGHCLLRSAQALPRRATERRRLALEARDGLLRMAHGKNRQAPPPPHHRRAPAIRARIAWRADVPIRRGA
jgi:hypothetical protein